MQLFYQNLKRLSDVAKVHAQESLSFFLELHLTHTQSDKCHPKLGDLELIYQITNLDMG